MKIVTVRMAKVMRATAVMARKQVVSADLAEAKAALDAANEEASADLDAGIALVGENYAAIKAEIAAKGVDMAGVKPSGFDEKIASIPGPSGDAVAADLIKGKTASTDVGVIIGSRPPAPVQWTGVSGNSGIAWPNPRFTDNGDDTVTDNLTGLMWSKNMTPTGAMNHDNAISYCDNLVLAGHNDWRLPTLPELISLIDFSVTPQSLPAGHPFINLNTSLSTWSRTTNPYSTYAHTAFYVRFFTCYIEPYARSNTTFFTPWPVRGPIAL